MFRLFAEHLYAYLRINKIIVACLFLGGIIAAFAGLYAYGNFMPWTSANSPEKLENRYFYLVSEGPVFVSHVRSFYEQLKEEFPVRGFYAELALTEDELPLTLKSGQPLLFGFQLGKSYSTSFPDQGEGAPDVNWFYIPLSTVLERGRGGQERLIERGSEIRLRGQTLRCIGEIDRLDILISADAAERMEAPIRSLTFFSEELLPDARVEDFNRRVEAEGVFRVQHSPLFFRGQDRQSMPVRIFVVVLLLVTAILAYGFLAHFLVDAQMKNHAILYLCGFNLRRLRRLITGDLLVYGLLSGLVASLIYWPLYGAYIHKYMLYQEVRYRFSDYLLLTAIFVVVSLLTILPFVRLKKRSLDLDRFVREA